MRFTVSICTTHQGHTAFRSGVVNNARSIGHALSAGVQFLRKLGHRPHAEISMTGRTCPPGEMLCSFEIDAAGYAYDGEALASGRLVA